ncbi:MAG TPA: chemotaxis response regulator protein-glutamate methylesterase [Burkholderiaceae bacterium]|nr:chemotaxis response regulator protein-glutamate methylesterase [Burkholderiaceae bacterium]
MKKIKVVVVDDSALVRNLLSALINKQPDMEAIGAANDPYMAREMIRNLNPDVITLDIEMPRMDGLDFLEKLMRLRPMPVVMVSTLTERGAEVTLRALELGAVDFVTKPKLGISTGLAQSGDEIAEKIRAAALARVARRISPAPPSASASASASPSASAAQVARPAREAAAAAPTAAAMLRRQGTEKLIAIGASTGGTEAVRQVLTDLPPDFPAVIITQHMPPGFTRSFAERLDRLSRIRVAEGEQGARILPGHAYIAPGGRHMKVVRSGANFVIEIDDSEPVNRHRPSVDVMFRSVAAAAGPNAIGVMLTGMGRDGADAMRAMREAGAFNIAQDEASCVVYGMPKEAVLAGAVHESLPIDRIARRLIEQVQLAGPVVHRV